MNTRYNIYYDCYDRAGWSEYETFFEEDYNEMIQDIKFGIREAGGGTALIYDSEGELIDQLHVSKMSAAIYDYEEKVSFLFDGASYIGIIKIVDKFGTFFDNSEPYYDIYVPELNTTIKHVRQSNIRRVH